MTLLSPRSWDDWISEYAQSHQHPVNRLCHTFGIPLIGPILRKWRDKPRFNDTLWI